VANPSPVTTSVNVAQGDREGWCGVDAVMNQSIDLPAGIRKPTLPNLRPMSLLIVHYNEPVLRTKGEKVITFDAALTQLATEMVATMHEAGGIGLAAQQVGRPLQLCVVDLRAADAGFDWEIDGARPPLDLFMPLVIANPKISVVAGTPETTWEEGCLSFPKIRGEIVRPDAITVIFQDERGVPHQLACDGLFARCVQHEIDHLNGVLFIERMDKATRAEIAEAVKALARETKAAAKK
ncbi:MAG: peptide deformylase, partial [Sulfuricaulis sp.]|nr:peptide deformylase [Sulfuricaulis sp.]